MVDLAELLEDLDEESADLDRMVAGLPDHDWQRPTPAPRWTIAHQIAHLAWTDMVAILAATDPEAFAGVLAEAARSATARSATAWSATAWSATARSAAVQDVTGLVDRKAAEGIAPPAAMLARWRQGRKALHETLRAIPADQKIAAHGRPLPNEPVRVDLTAPDGQVWEFGPVDAANRLAGSALDFCLLVTQPRHRADLGLRASGSVADEWLNVAQAFAGPPGQGREPTTGHGREPTTGHGREPAK